jgi:hypothetical protein
MGSATRDDGWLCRHLYEQRREPVLRQAREWMIEFMPRTLDDVMRVMDGREGREANRFFRQATSYWEMICTLLGSPGISIECRELFAKTTREFFLVYAKLAPFLGELRAQTRPNLFEGMEGFCRSLPDHDAAMAYFTRLNEKIRERVALAGQKEKARAKPKGKARGKAARR